MKLIRLFYCLFLLGVLLALTTAIALAWPEKPFDKIVISGPNIKGEIEITDSAILAALGSAGTFMDFVPITPPEVDAGYELVRYYKDDTGVYSAFDRLRYYPNPTGGPGYVFYVEGISYGPAHNAGKWFHATPQTDAAMQNLLMDLDSLEPASSLPPADNVSVSPAPENKLTVAVNNETALSLTENFRWPVVELIGLVAGAVILVGGWLFLK